MDTETGEYGEHRLKHSDGEAEKFYRELNTDLGNKEDGEYPAFAIDRKDDGDYPSCLSSRVLMA